MKASPPAQTGLSDEPHPPAERRVRLRTLVMLRWLAVSGQTATVLAVAYGLKFETPVAACLALIAASAWLNIVLSLAQPGQRQLSDFEAGWQLLFDALQLSALIALTGGLDNPFVVLLGAPMVMAFSALKTPYALAVAGAALASAAGMTVWSAPLPWRDGMAYEPPEFYRWGLATALVSGAAFMSVFAWRAAAEARRMSGALAVTQAVLAREQRLSALGGLAAAAAHELGTPLGTIQVTAKEMLRALPPGAELRGDAELLVSQAERCRDILRQLSRRGAEGDIVHATLSLRALIEEAVEPLKGIGPEIDVRLEPPPGGGAGSAQPPLLRRSPEVLYALSNYVENAVDFARARVDVTGRWGEDFIELEVADDGPGFSSDVLAKLGEPYVSRRSERQTHGGLGLGFFIAKTFVERTGGAIEFGNRRPPLAGALVRARWPRHLLQSTSS